MVSSRICRILERSDCQSHEGMPQPLSVCLLCLCPVRLPFPPLFPFPFHFAVFSQFSFSTFLIFQYSFTYSCYFSIPNLSEAAFLGDSTTCLPVIFCHLMHTFNSLWKITPAHSSFDMVSWSRNWNKIDWSSWCVDKPSFLIMECFKLDPITVHWIFKFPLWDGIHLNITYYWFFLDQIVLRILWINVNIHRW